VHPKWFRSLWYIRCNTCTYLASRLALSQNGLNQAPTWASSPGVSLGASKTTFEPMVHLAQTVHLSCTNTNTVSKRIKTRFHMTQVASELHRVRPKWFLSLWYVWHKPCTYLASKLALSPNRLNRTSTQASSPRSIIGCVQNDFYTYCTFGANHAPMLYRH
jgi:hypothetical protein